ncbi:MAG: DNA repair protein RecO [Phycisphaerales bacterium]
MPHVRDEAICVRHWDFSETSQTVSLFCREHGLLRGIAKGAKRVGGRFSGGIDLLTRGQVIAIVKPGRELSTLTDWTLLRSWRSLRNELAANQAAFYMADLVQRMVAADDPHPKLYDALVASLDACEAGLTEEATLAFQWVALSETGHAPRIELPDDAAATLSFVPDEGGVASGARPGAWKIRRQTVEFLARLGPDACAETVATETSRETLSRANRLLAAYVRHLLGAQPATMRLLFPEL